MISEKYKFFKDVSVAFFGVSAALLLNSLYDGCNKKASYLSLGKAIVYEAIANDTVFHDSFRKQISDSGKKNDSIIIYRSFELTVVENCLNNDNFMRHTSDSTIKILTNYILVLRRMNSVRNAYQKYLEEPNVKPYNLSHARETLFKYFDETDRNIKKVESLYSTFN